MTLSIGKRIGHRHAVLRYFTGTAQNLSVIVLRVSYLLRSNCRQQT
jgi:hypothetical protein